MTSLKKTDLVSVLIACYNGEKYLDRCLTALLEQTYDNIEVIIVDDGSEDSSKEIIKKYIVKFEQSGKKLVYLYQKNSGQATAIDVALKHMHGDYFTWQDVDDFYERDGIENMYYFLRDNTEYDFMRGEVLKWDQDSGDDRCFLAKSKFPTKENIFGLYLFEKDAYCFPGIFMVKTIYFDKCVEDRNIYKSRAGQNWQLILPVAYKGRCGYLDKVVYNYTIHNDSHSHLAKNKTDKLARYKSHEDILIHVINDIKSMNPVTKCIYKIMIKVRYVVKKFRVLFSKKEEI